MIAPSSNSRFSPVLTCALLVGCTVLGLAGIDLVLPAIPHIPEILGGNESIAQLIIAAFVIGTAVGLLLFGSLGARFERRWLLFISLCAYALLSLFCGLATDIYTLIVLRFFQGLSSSAAAVFAPVIIRAIFDEAGATKAMGALGSIESLAPGVAPIIGLWLLNLGGWQLSFFVTAALTGVLAIAILVVGRAIPTVAPGNREGSYLRLLRSPVYLRYSISQALVLGGLLVFVFAAPAVIVHTMDGELSDFIIMQFVGVSCFIIAANVTGFLVNRWGAEYLIMLGTVLSFIGAILLLLYSIFGNNNPLTLSVIFPMMNIGLGLRGPPGFLWAIIAGDGDDDRASSLMFLAITGTSAGGTVLFAPFITLGLPALCLTIVLIQFIALALLVILPKYSQDRE